jgi:hypothetical protein
MPVSTFDIISVSGDIKNLHTTLTDVLSRETDGKIVITNEEAQKIASMIVELANKIEKKI